MALALDNPDPPQNLESIQGRAPVCRYNARPADGNAQETTMDSVHSVTVRGHGTAP
jgi:hypothetical protein